MRNPLLWRGMGTVTAGERRPRGGRPDGALSPRPPAPCGRGGRGGSTLRGGGRPGPPGAAAGRAPGVEWRGWLRRPARPRGRAAGGAGGGGEQGRRAQGVCVCAGRPAVPGARVCVRCAAVTVPRSGWDVGPFRECSMTCKRHRKGVNEGLGRGRRRGPPCPPASPRTPAGLPRGRGPAARGLPGARSLM